MRVLSFIFAFVAALGLVAAFPAPLDVASPANGLDSYCGPIQNATTHLTTVQQGLVAIAAYAEADIQVNAITTSAFEAASILLCLVGQIKAVANVNLSVDLTVLVEAIVDLLGVVLLLLDVLLAVALRLPLSVALGLVASLTAILQAVVSLIACLQFAAVGPLAGVLVSLFATVNAALQLFVRVCAAVKLHVSL